MSLSTTFISPLQFCRPPRRFTLQCKMSDAPQKISTSTKWSEEAIAKHAAIESPHAGSYYTRRRPRPPYFEGWFLRIVLPESDRSYAFMFSIEAKGPGTMQLLDPDDVLHKLALSPEKHNRFYASPNRFSVGHWGYTKAISGEPRMLPDEHFESKVLQGYQLTKTSSHGRFFGDHGLIQWGFQFDPVLAWGERGKQPRSTSTWLAHLPLFDPGYQILMGHGVVRNGYIEVDGVRKDVTGGVVYSEKNWGSAFPRKWWWVQANAFDAEPDLTVTTLGALRRVLGMEEVVGMVAVHYKGLFYEFAPWTFKSLDWEVEPWGSWKVSSKSRTGHIVEVSAQTSEGPVAVLGPSANGMIFNVRDNAKGHLCISLYNPSGVAILKDVRCTNAQVEVGGGPWDETWVASSNPMPQPLRGLVNMFNRPPVQTSQ